MAKLSRRKSKVLLAAAVFISLSGFVSTIEAHKCYWCGPLADQVHRSRRSQPCNSSTYEVTTCDPGYNHCAVIATSPPLTESRVCVKVYQDECYSVYCNSSRHWRVVCPCRGDLCNGYPTQRETEAFTSLFQKTKRSSFRIKKIRTRRALVTSSNFISARRPRVENITAAETTTVNNIVNLVTNEDQMESDQPDKMVFNDVESTSVSYGMSNVPVDNEVTNPINVETKDIQQNVIETTPENMEIKFTEISTTDNDITHKDESTVQDIKPNKDSLPAEALQLNSSPDNQTTEIITSLQSTPSVTTTTMITKEPNKNNTATIIHNQIFTSIIGIILQHYL